MNTVVTMVKLGKGISSKTMDWTKERTWTPAFRYLCFWLRNPAPPASQTETEDASSCSLEEVLPETSSASSLLHDSPPQTTEMSPPTQKKTINVENNQQFSFFFWKSCSVALNSILTWQDRSIFNKSANENLLPTQPFQQIMTPSNHMDSGKPRFVSVYALTIEKSSVNTGKIFPCKRFETNEGE